MKKYFIIIFVIISIIIFITSQHGATTKVTRVIDGDTVEINYNKNYVVRILGIDSPERGEKCFNESSFLAKVMLENGIVKLIKDKISNNRDVYGRYLRYVEIDGEDFGKFMLEKKHAVEYNMNKEYDYDYEREKEYQKLSTTINC